MSASYFYVLINLMAAPIVLNVGKFHDTFFELTTVQFSHIMSFPRANWLRA